MPKINEDGSIGWYEWESYEPREYLGISRENYMQPEKKTEDIMFISLPPKDVVFKNVEEVIEWYKNNPKRIGIIKNVLLPEIKND